MLKWHFSIALQPKIQKRFQKYKNWFKSILFNNFYFGRTQLLIVKVILGYCEKGLLCFLHNMYPGLLARLVTVATL